MYLCANVQYVYVGYVLYMAYIHAYVQIPLNVLYVYKLTYIETVVYSPLKVNVLVIPRSVL